MIVMMYLLHGEPIPQVFWTEDRSLVVIAIVLSLFGLLYSTYFNTRTLKLTKKHNKKTTLPIIDTNVCIGGETDSYVLLLNNCGFGPASISKVTFIHDDKNFDSIFSLLNATFEDFLKEIIGSSTETTIVPNNVIAHSSELEVVNIKFVNRVFYLKVVNFLRTVNIKVEFKSIYGKAFVFETKMNNTLTTI